MTDMVKTTFTSVRTDPKTKAALIVAAEADGRSVSSLISKIIAEWFAARKAAALLLALLAAGPAQAQLTYQHPPRPAQAPHTPPAAPPGSQPTMLINPPPASWQGQWRPEYGAMIAPPWTPKP